MKMRNKISLTITTVLMTVCLFVLTGCGKVFYDEYAIWKNDQMTFDASAQTNPYPGKYFTSADRCFCDFELDGVTYNCFVNYVPYINKTGGTFADLATMLKIDQLRIEIDHNHNLSEEEISAMREAVRELYGKLSFFAFTSKLIGDKLTIKITRDYVFERGESAVDHTAFPQKTTNRSIPFPQKKTNGSIMVYSISTK